MKVGISATYFMLKLTNCIPHLSFGTEELGATFGLEVSHFIKKLLPSEVDPPLNFSVFHGGA